MRKTKEALLALSPKRQASELEAGGSSPEPRQGSTLGRFSRRRAGRQPSLPELERTDEEFQREWGITKAEEVRRGGAGAPAGCVQHRRL